jgi:signal transduction histidine kinase
VTGSYATGRQALVVSADSELTSRLRAAATRPGKTFWLSVAGTVAEAQTQLRQTPAPPAAIVLLDELAAGTESLAAAARCFLESPLIILAAPERQAEFAELAAAADLHFVSRTGDFLPLILGLLQRYTHAADGSTNGRRNLDAWSEDFLEFLRHEVNNPLTGILGNAEILLARSNQLPSAVVQRLETIVGLAVRLREAVRQLSVLSEKHASGMHTV